MAANHNFYPVKRNDTWPNASIGNYVDFQMEQNLGGIDVPINLIGASICCQFRLKEGEAVAFEFSTTNGKITITDAMQGKFKFNDTLITANAGIYKYDIEVKLADGTVFTWLEGDFTLNNDISRPTV